MVGDPLDFAYFSFDDDTVLAAGQADAIGFVADLPARTILDEAQRAPWPAGSGPSGGGSTTPGWL